MRSRCLKLLTLLHANFLKANCSVIGGKTLEWINAFLCFRQQRVVNRINSDWAQGIVLGSLLLSMLNDMSVGFDSQIRLFADDCFCYREIKTVEDTLKLQKDIDLLGSWARKWCMMVYGK